MRSYGGIEGLMSILHYFEESEDSWHVLYEWLSDNFQFNISEGIADDNFYVLSFLVKAEWHIVYSKDITSEVLYYLYMMNFEKNCLW